VHALIHGWETQGHSNTDLKAFLPQTVWGYFQSHVISVLEIHPYPIISAKLGQLANKFGTVAWVSEEKKARLIT
jgi:hypothetical protein